MPATDRPERSYHRVYLLTLWREGERGIWRAALRPVDGGSRLGFAALEQLAAYLLCLTEEDQHERARPGTDAPSDEDAQGEQHDDRDDVERHR